MPRQVALALCTPRSPSPNLACFFGLQGLRRLWVACDVGGDGGCSDFADDGGRRRRWARTLAGGGGCREFAMVVTAMVDEVVAGTSRPS